MRTGHLYGLIVICVLLGSLAVAGEPADGGAQARALKAKQERAYELRRTMKSDERTELIRLIAEIGPEKFFEPFKDDPEEVLGVFEQLLRSGAKTTQQSAVCADLAGYLVKDERPSIRLSALKRLQEGYHLYANKAILSAVLYNEYKAAGDDEELREEIAKTLVLVGSNDQDGKAPRKLTSEEYQTNLGRFKDMMADASPRVRKAVVENLPRDHGTMLGTSIGLLEDDDDAGVRAAVIDFYREAKVKTVRVCDMAKRSLGSSSLGELEAAIDYCQQMKLDDAREPMFAALRRYANVESDTKLRSDQIRQLKLQMLRVADERGWTDAIGDLGWIYKNDTDPRVRTRAAHTILRLSGKTTVLLGTVEETFPRNMVEPEMGPFMLAFDAWLLTRDAEHADETEAERLRAQAKDLREEALIEFTENVYDIAKARLVDRDFANKRRGLQLVMDIGPEEFAQEVNLQEFNEILQSLRVLWERYKDRERTANRQTARMVLAFTQKEDLKFRMTALSTLLGLAPFCDKVDFLKKLTPMLKDPNPDVVNMVRQVGNRISSEGYSSVEERKKEQELRELEGKSDSAGD